MERRLPVLAVVLGALGLLPFVACALASLSPNPLQAQRMLESLSGYGAVILSFVGAVHWGFALHPSRHDIAVPKAERERLVLGILPAFIGWIALLITFTLSAWWGLAILIAGFVGTMGVERRAAALDLMPPGYIWLRWALTIPVVLILGAILLLHLFGISNQIPINAG